MRSEEQCIVNWVERQGEYQGFLKLTVGTLNIISHLQSGLQCIQDITHFTNNLMKQETFEEFMKEKHAEDYHGLDDDMPDAFDNWLGEIDGADMMDYAEEFGRKVYLQGFDRAAKVANEAIQKI